MGTDIARILTEFEDSINSPKSNKTKKHHDIFQETFLKDVQKVYDGMVSNPLNLPEMTNISNTSLVFLGTVFHNITILEAMGESEFDTFLSDRLIKRKVAINAKVSKNQYVLPGNVDPSRKNKKED